MLYDDHELERLARDAESDLVERKEALEGEAARTIREAVCAFANDLPGHGRAGVVLVGLKDDGSPSGLAITDDLLRTLADIKTNGNIVPPPSLFVHARSVGSAELAVVTVMPADSPPVRYKGRIWVRVGPRKSLATAQDERVLNERRRHANQPFDVAPVASASLDDLDLIRFEREYLPAAVAPDVLDANDRTLQQTLASTKMVRSTDDQRPTVLGLLVLGKDPRAALPGAYVQFLRIQGSSLADPIVDEQLIDGAVVDVVRRLDEKLEAHNRVAVDYTRSAVETRSPQYPPAALQQLTRNAVLHRTYENTNAPCRVAWFDDRVEIYSPGGPFGEVTSANFGSPYATDYRNPNLAEAMRVLGLVQKFGSGIAVARRALHNNGNPDVEFLVEATSVLVTLRPAP